MRETHGSASFDSVAPAEERKVYLLAGEDVNSNRFDTRERFERVVAGLVEAGQSEQDAEQRAWELREAEFGVGSENGFYGEPVLPWCPGNFAVLAAPLSLAHVDEYERRFGELPYTTCAKLLRIMARAHAICAGLPAEPFVYNDKGGIIEPGFGALYGSVEEAARRLCVYVFSCHGRVVARDPIGGYETVNATFGEIYERMPLDFTHRYVDDEKQVFEEVMRISGIFDIDVLRV